MPALAWVDGGRASRSGSSVAAFASLHACIHASVRACSSTAAGNAHALGRCSDTGGGGGPCVNHSPRKPCNMLPNRAAGITPLPRFRADVAVSPRNALTSVIVAPRCRPAAGWWSRASGSHTASCCAAGAGRTAWLLQFYVAPLLNLPASPHLPLLLLREPEVATRRCTAPALAPAPASHQGAKAHLSHL